MAKVSAFNPNNPFNAFTWVKTPGFTSSQYYLDEKRKEKEKLKESEVLDNDFSTNKKIISHKIANTLTVYPVKGFKGDKNSNFYEYLTMGMFPYVTGGLTFIALFNGITKYLNLSDAKHAKKYGHAMGLGVIFYGIAKSVSKKFISVPVRLKTGIDMDLPYRKVVDLIATSKEEYEAEEERLKALKAAGLPDEKSFEYHKVFESVDFPRFDLLYKDSKEAPRNQDFDIIAEKNGFGTNLKDSDQEVKPFIKEVVTKARTAQNISQYLWAATGVGLGVQDAWTDLLNFKGLKKINKTYYEFGKEVLKHIKDNVKKAFKEFYYGGPEGKTKTSAKIAGRAILGLAVLSTVIGALNAMRNPYVKNMNGSGVFKTNEKVVED